MRLKIVTLLLVIFISHISSSNGHLSQNLKTVTILFTTNNNGILKECECSRDCHGGLAQRKTLLDRIKKEVGDFLLVDAGDFLTTMGRQRQDEYVIAAYEALGYDAINIGDQELLNGWMFFQRKVLGSHLKLISANLEDASSKELVTSPYVIKTVKGVRVAVVGIISPGAFKFFDQKIKDDFSIRPYWNALQQTLSAVKQRAELIVLLTHLKGKETIQLAETVSGYQVIIQGHTQDRYQDSYQMVNGKIIIQAGYEGEYLGVWICI